MPIETDEMALARAGSAEGGATWKFYDSIEQKTSKSKNAELVPYSIFFAYMRFNRDGSFASYNYYYAGKDNEPINPSSDPNVPNSLGYFVRDMALYARPSSPNDGRYQYWGRELDNVQFPSRYSYCVYFMDDLCWRFLLDSKKRPVITFNEEKNGKKYNKHKYAFSAPELVQVEMPIFNSSDTDVRQAAVMINRMANKNDKWLKKNERESFSFDLWMRVQYAGSSNGVTLVIDPGGDNLGPPGPPPVLP